MNEEKILGPERQKRVVDWRPLFTEEMLKEAARPEVQKGVRVIRQSDSFMEAGVTMPSEAAVISAYSRARSRAPREAYSVVIYERPKGWNDQWTRHSFRCTCTRESWRGSEPCVHAAAVLLHWENERGPFMVEESDYEYRERMRREERIKRIQARRKVQEEALAHPVPALDQISGKSGGGLLLYDLQTALSGWKTGLYPDPVMKEIGEEEIAVSMEEERDGTRYLRARRNVYDPLIGRYLSSECSLYSDRLTVDSCSCDLHRNGQYADILCPPLLAMVRALAKRARQENDSDMTDDAARLFFSHLHSSQATLEKAEAGKLAEKKADLLLLPRIVVEGGVPTLSFKIGRKNGKMLILRSLRDMTVEMDREGTLELSKTETLDFSRETFAEESLPWLTYVQRRVEDTADINERLARRASWNARPASVALKHQQELGGALLDQFYDTAEGQSCEYTDKDNNIKNVMIPVEHRKTRFPLTVERISDAAGTFAGVMVSGMVPAMLEGGRWKYILNQSCLSRLEPREEQVISPFVSVADDTGLFRFRVGRNHLQEFYYRILPSLLDNPFVSIEDRTEGEVQAYLPPEPRFTFWLDLEKDTLLCRCDVAYEEKSYLLNSITKGKEDYRDTEQENRVRNALKEYFPQLNGHWYTASVTDDQLFDFLTEGIPKLEKYGTVHGTDYFRRQNVRPASGFQVGVSVKSGLMDITVTSRDYSPEELLAVLDSYQKKKRYYRLRSGDFVDLEDGSELHDMMGLFGSMDLLPTDAIRSKIHLPLYRALYLDRMLEEHEGLAANRDRTYRALVRNFRAIRDAEYEVPSAMENVLRPYQVYGYKWLRTLGEAGFGGILADEMGLGKTIQMIAFFCSEGEKGREKPSLVVCPASLVYNWQEEIRRFAPDLRVGVVAGGAAARKTMLSEIGAREKAPALPAAAGEGAPKKRGRKPKAERAAAPAGGADVYITSYDLLKRDIALYEGLEFSTCVLDEAQFIKNQKAAVTKSVKLIHAEHRFALTGTPIENRLSELWSIFDFLMPGFLYGSGEFISRFENPISRDKDEEMTGRLKKMVGPFILRRLKQDVLKDLPAKLEEIRYARFDGEQQKLYDAQVVHMKQMLKETTGQTGEDKIKILAELTRIRQVCCDPSLLFENYSGESAKREACLDLVRSAMDGGHRMLIFSQFTSMLALLEEDLNREGIAFYKITGATPKEMRVSLVSRFNEGDVPVFLISLKAGGTGLNLTGADVVIHYDPWWNLAAQNQATDRAHRIGQTRQVTVYRMIVKDTIEERILELQEAKKDLADAILEGRGESLMNLSSEELLALLN